MTLANTELLGPEVVEGGLTLKYFPKKLWEASYKSHSVNDSWIISARGTM